MWCGLCLAADLVCLGGGEEEPVAGQEVAGAVGGDVTRGRAGRVHAELQEQVTSGGPRPCPHPRLGHHAGTTEVRAQFCLLHGGEREGDQKQLGLEAVQRVSGPGIEEQSAGGEKERAMQQSSRPQKMPRRQPQEVTVNHVRFRKVSLFSLLPPH